MSGTQFDLEQQILQCWNVTDDVSLVYEYVMECDNLEKERDNIANMLLGIEALYALKFQKTFNTFEQLLKEYYAKVHEKANSSGSQPVGEAWRP